MTCCPGRIGLSIFLIHAVESNRESAGRTELDYLIPERKLSGCGIRPSSNFTFKISE